MTYQPRHARTPSLPTPGLRGMADRIEVIEEGTDLHGSIQAAWLSSLANEMAIRMDVMSGIVLPG